MAEATSGTGLRNIPGRAILYLLASSFLLVVLDTAVKWLAKGYSPLQIGFLRYLMGLVIAAGIAAQNGGLATLRTRRFTGHLLRSILNLTTMLTFYYALRLIPLADAIAIGFAAPLFTTALSVPMLKERVGPRRWAAVALGFVGVLLIVQPTGGMNVGALLALLSSLCWSLTLISSRQLSGTEPSHTILFYYSTAVVVGLGATMPTVWIMPQGLDWLWFAVCGLAGSFGQYCVNQAYRYGEASMVAPLDYTSLIWATFAGYVVFGQLPTALVLGGAAIIVASSLYIARRETVLARARRAVEPGSATPGATP
jgi:drug/metabolite transporter (DMT)-like permease